MLPSWIIAGCVDIYMFVGEKLLESLASIFYFLYNY